MQDYHHCIIIAGRGVSFCSLSFASGLLSASTESCVKFRFTPLILYLLFFCVVDSKYRYEPEKFFPFVWANMERTEIHYLLYHQPISKLSRTSNSFYL